MEFFKTKDNINRNILSKIEDIFGSEYMVIEEDIEGKKIKNGKIVFGAKAGPEKKSHQHTS